MQMYALRATSQDRIEWTLEAAVGLDQSPETKPFVPVVLAANENLKAAMLNNQQAKDAAIAPRVAVRFADWNIDQQLRSMHRACEIADGGGRGAISRALFPNGLSPVVAGSGPGQVALTQQFLTQAKACTVKGADRVTGEWLPRVEAALNTLVSAMQDRQRALTARAAASAAEESARQDHLLAMDKVANEVRALFPKDRKRVDLIFPPANYKPRTKPEAEPTDEDLPAPSDES